MIEDCVLQRWWAGSQVNSKRFESWPSPGGDLVRAAIVDRPLEHIQVTTPQFTRAYEIIPRARRILAPEPLQHLEVTTLSCTGASTCIPRAALAPEPLQYLQMTTLGCPLACACIPGASLAPEPLQYLKVTSLSCVRACLFIPRAALAPEPLQCLHMAIFAGFGKECPIQLVPVLGFQPLQGLQLTSTHCEEEKARKKSEAKTKKKRRLWRRRLTCSVDDFWVKPIGSS